MYYQKSNPHKIIIEKTDLKAQDLRADRLDPPSMLFWRKTSSVELEEKLTIIQFNTLSLADFLEIFCGSKTTTERINNLAPSWFAEHWYTIINLLDLKVY